MGIEPMASSLPRTRSTPELPGRNQDFSDYNRHHRQWQGWSGRRDSNPRPLAWKANALAS